MVLKQVGMIESDDIPREIVEDIAKIGSSPHMPVPLGLEAREGLDLEILMRTLWELRNDVKQIKDVLDHLAAQDTAGWSDRVGGTVVDTYAGDHGYSTDPSATAATCRARKGLIESALRATGGRRRQAAERLGISERTLYRKINKYDLG